MLSGGKKSARNGAPPDSAEAHVSRANAFLKGGDFKRAAVEYGKAVAVDPDHSVAHMNLAGILTEQGHHHRAIEHLERAGQLDTQSTTIYTNLALVYEQLGQREQAEAAALEALRRNPNDIPALCHLASLMRGKLPQEHLEKVEKLLADSGDLSRTQRRDLHAALGRVYDARKDYKTAAEHMARANAETKAELIAQGKPYNVQNVIHHVDRAIEIYTGEYIREMGRFGIENDRPVFVVGLPRSGTTLTESILAAHPDVFGAGELPYMLTYLMALPKAMNLSLRPVDCIPHMRGSDIRKLARDYLRRLPAQAGGARRVVDKQPANCLLLGLVVSMFPNAKIIYISRDSRDIALSSWMVQFARLRWACDKEWIAVFMRNNLRILSHWWKVLPIEVLHVEYEKLVTDLETEARRMIDWIELPWDPQCLNFHQRTTPVKTASIMQVRQPVHSRSVGRWKNYTDYLSDLFDAVTDQQPGAS